MNAKLNGTLFVLSTIAVLCAPTALMAQDRTLDEIREDIDTIATGVTALEGQFLDADDFERQNYFAARLSDGQLFYMAGDYDRAANVLMDLVDTPRNKNHPAYSDALYFLGESLFAIRNIRGAETAFRSVVQRGKPDQRAVSLARLLEIALIGTGSGKGKEYAQRAEKFVKGNPNPILLYTLGKYLYFKGSLGKARFHFAQIPRVADEWAKGTYFVGVIDVRKGKPDVAQTSFNTVVENIPRDSKDESLIKVRDEALIALARLAYEEERFEESIDFYSQVARNSRVFDDAMYENVWVSIKQKKYDQALRKLEILLISQPDVLRGPEARLLEGKLLLMQEKYEQAEGAFDKVVDRFEPIRSQMYKVKMAHPNLEAHFGQIIGERIEEFDLTTIVPDEVTDFTDPVESSGEAVELVQDVAAQRRDLENAARAIDKIKLALNAANRIEIFPQIYLGALRAVELRAWLGMLRADINDHAGQTVTSNEYKALKAERAKWQKLYRAVPRTILQMKARDADVDSRMAELDREAHRLNLEIRSIEAQLTAIDQYKTANRGQRFSEAAAAQLNEETNAAKALKNELEQLVHRIEDERLQVGMNDAATTRDEVLRKRFFAALKAESNWLIRNQELLGNVMRQQTYGLEARVVKFGLKANQVVEKKAQDIHNLVKTEEKRVSRFGRKLKADESATRALGGAIAARSFNSVLAKVDAIILDGDLGLVDVAWKQKDDRSKKIDGLIDKQRADLDALEKAFSEVTGE